LKGFENEISDNKARAEDRGNDEDAVVAEMRLVNFELDQLWVPLRRGCDVVVHIFPK